jgi:hypothetical protein
MDHGQRNTGFRSRFTASRLMDRCPLLARFARQITASRLSDRGCRLPDHGQRFAGWYVWGMGRGAWRGLFNSFKRATQAS